MAERLKTPKDSIAHYSIMAFKNPLHFIPIYYLPSTSITQNLKYLICKEKICIVHYGFESFTPESIGFLTLEPLAIHCGREQKAEQLVAKGLRINERNGVERERGGSFISSPSDGKASHQALCLIVFTTSQ